MDALDRLAEPARELLARVDDRLAEGAPEAHPVWPLLRRMRLLPGEALGVFLELHPGPLATAGHAVRRHVGEYDDACAALADPVLWSGPAAGAYDEARGALLRHLDEGPESLVGRLEATAGYADALAHWVEGSRLAVARVLAEVLGSAEAVRVRAESPAGALAAAEIATRVLAVLGVAYDGAETLLREWSPSLGESTWRPPTGGPAHHGRPVRVG
ncbi:hypothetical protein ACFY3U_09125 [Micromonospora sp. NPDC000089]|uniref:hypothetical protein n=1 Tax=unclassified Micromonospora TaxID=2617518 RepID=UPI0036C2B325